MFSQQIHAIAEPGAPSTVRWKAGRNGGGGKNLTQAHREVSACSRWGATRCESVARAKLSGSVREKNFVGSAFIAVAGKRHPKPKKGSE
jgi:hypothetical protein